MSSENTLIIITVAGITYSVKRHVVNKSVTLLNLIEDVGSDGIVLDISEELWKIVLAYLTESDAMPRRRHPRYPEEWELKLLNRESSQLMELLKIADYLEIGGLIDATAAVIGTRIKSMSIPEIRKFLGIVDNLSEHEHAIIDAENTNIVIY